MRTKGEDKTKNISEKDHEFILANIARHISLTGPEQALFSKKLETLWLKNKIT